MNDKLAQLKDILKDMFQMNNSDLDFGIYRIMNLKNAQISEFFDKKLDNIALSKKDQDIIYSNMVEFFGRYYQNGDFVSQRRYKDGSTYSIPYDGEEVKLHWANADQYYIKTSENFKNYRFKTEFATVDFKIKEAESSTDNNKGQKRYFIFHSSEESNQKLTLYFEYKDVKRRGQNLQEKINFESFETIKERCKLEDYGLSKLEPTQKDKTRTLLQKHLTKYTAKNSFDYFIHKDLGKFLRGELDNFIKSVLIDLDDILGSSLEIKEEKFTRVKIFKDLSLEVIIFLAQLENFQKQLWEKKKFVVESNYCITLDKIDAKYHDEIFKNRDQLEEWQKLFGTTEKSDFLVVDTKFFSTDFKYKLLSEFDNLDDEINGVLINSENFGALNLLQERYKEQVKTVYIDPPYNTKEGDFLYKDSYKHSSWMSMIQDRILLMKHLVNTKGRFYCSIDDRENSKLLELLYLHLGKDNYLNSITWEKRTKSQNTKTSKYMLQSKIEYIHPFRFNDKRQEFNLEISGQKNYPELDKVGVYRVQKAEQDSLDRAHAALSMSYPILGTYPAKGKCWKFGKDTAQLYLDENRVFLKNNWPHIIFRPEHEEQDVHKPFWSHFFEKEVYGTAESGLKVLDKELGFGKDFLTVKPVELITKLLFHTSDTNQIILDYFAGSGTTGHATINLNRKHEGKRKYILVEMGEYFEQLLKPRVQKVIYSDSWKDGKPTTQNGISQMFKYFTLESYEETLNNLSIKSKDNIPSLFENEYMLNYILDDETKTSGFDIDKFKKPFDYTLEISTGVVGETKTTKVDLVETFNYLLGLKVEHIKSENSLVIVSGENMRDEKLLVIWRDEKAEISQELIDRFKGYDRVYINGDVDIDAENIYLIEKEFSSQMFKGL